MPSSRAWWDGSMCGAPAATEAATRATGATAPIATEALGAALGELSQRGGLVIGELSQRGEVAAEAVTQFFGLLFGNPGTVPEEGGSANPSPLGRKRSVVENAEAAAAAAVASLAAAKVAEDATARSAHEEAAAAKAEAEAEAARATALAAAAADAVKARVSGGCKAGEAESSARPISLRRGSSRFSNWRSTNAPHSANVHSAAPNGSAPSSTSLRVPASKKPAASTSKTFAGASPRVSSNPIAFASSLFGGAVSAVTGSSRGPLSDRQKSDRQKSDRQKSDRQKRGSGGGGGDKQDSTRVSSYRRAASAAAARISGSLGLGGASSARAGQDSGRGCFADTTTTSASLEQITTYRMSMSSRTPEKTTLRSFREDTEVHLNPTCLEMYLPDVEFERTFAMPKEDFYKLRQWKQREMKKRVGLF